MKNFSSILYYVVALLTAGLAIMFAFGKQFESALLSLIVGIMLLNEAKEGRDNENNKK